MSHTHAEPEPELTPRIQSDACFQSPASLPAAITVGSSDINDMVSTFSNVGCCVDIYAPGTNIAAAWIGGGNIVISGTSMA